MNKKLVVVCMAALFGLAQVAPAAAQTSPSTQTAPKKTETPKKSAAKKSAEVDPALAAELAAELGVDLDALKASRAAADRGWG